MGGCLSVELPCRATDQYLEIADVALQETSLTVAEVILPHLDEFVPVALTANLGVLLEESSAPPPKSWGIVSGDLFQMQQLKAGSLDQPCDPTHGWDMAAWEDVVLAISWPGVFIDIGFLSYITQQTTEQSTMDAAIISWLVVFLQLGFRLNKQLFVLGQAIHQFLDIAHIVVDMGRDA